MNPFLAGCLCATASCGFLFWAICYAAEVMERRRVARNDAEGRLQSIERGLHRKVGDAEHAALVDRVAKLEGFF